MSPKWEEGLLTSDQISAGYLFIEDDHCLYLFKNKRFVCAFSNCATKEEVQLALAEDIDKEAQQD